MRSYAALFVVGIAVSFAAGCGDSDTMYGLTLRVTGDYNSWYKDADAPTLEWDGAHYRGVVALPGDELNMRLYAPRTGVFIGGVAQPAVTSGDTSVPGNFPTEVALSVSVLHISTPLSARYFIDYDPQSGWLRFDLAPDADRDLPPEVAPFVTALRSSDQLSPSEQVERANAFIVAMQLASTQGVETPLRSAAGGYDAITFIALSTQPTATDDLSLVGDFNDWTAGHDPLHRMLGGQLCYLARRTHGVRFEYLFDRAGTRSLDPYNLELAWDGANLPPNPANLLGGNVGNFNSAAFTAGYVEQGARLRRLPLPAGPHGVGESIVYLPAGYSEQTSQSYPSIYIHDGKDAIVRGRYDRLLSSLAEQKQLPPLIAVFLSTPADPTERLATLTHFSDPRFPEVTPQGADYATYLLETVVPAVDSAYRTTSPRSMLGIDMAGPFAFDVAWTDTQHRFLRVASQSGRFGWGDVRPANGPYIKLFGNDMSNALQRLTLDWSDSDQYQVQVHDTLRGLLSSGGYLNKVQFSKQMDLSSDVWENLRARASLSLRFLFQDLIPKS